MKTKILLIILPLILIIIGGILFFLLRNTPAPIQEENPKETATLAEDIIRKHPDYNIEEVEEIINEPLKEEIQETINKGIEEIEETTLIEGIPDDEFVIPPEDEIPDNLMLVQQDDGSWVYVELYPDGFESMDDYFEWLEQEVERQYQEIQNEHNDYTESIENIDTENSDNSDNYISNPSIDEEPSSNNSEPIGRNPDDYDSGIRHDPSTGQVADVDCSDLMTGG